MGLTWFICLGIELSLVSTDRSGWVVMYVKQLGEDQVVSIF